MKEKNSLRELGDEQNPLVCCSVAPLKFLQKVWKRNMAKH